MTLGAADPPSVRVSLLTVEQLLRLGVALHSGAFCCLVNGPSMSPGAGAGAAGWLSHPQDGGP